MSKDTHPGTPDSYVEFIYRVHSDGRRERRATVFLIGPDGRPVPGPSRPQGALARFVAEAVTEVTGDGVRRVVIDERRGRR